MTRSEALFRSWGLLPALTLIIALSTGCGGHYLTRKAHDAAFTAEPRIAVLPFDNFTNKDQVAAKVTEYFQTLMTNRPPFVIVEAGTTFESLRRHRIRSSILLSEAQMDTLALELGIQYVLTGSVFEYSEVDNTYLGKIPQISFDARLVDCRSKKTVWTGVSNDSGDRKELLFGIGVTRSADELARKMAETLVSDLQGVFQK